MAQFNDVFMELKKKVKLIQLCIACDRNRDQIFKKKPSRESLITKKNQLYCFKAQTANLEKQNTSIFSFFCQPKQIISGEFRFLGL